MGNNSHSRRPFKTVKKEYSTMPWYYSYYKLGGSSSECCKLWYIRPYTMGMINIYIYCSNYIGNQFKIAIRHLGAFVIYGRCITAKCCVLALCVTSCVRTALIRGILAIYHTPRAYCLNKHFRLLEPITDW